MPRDAWKNLSRLFVDAPLHEQAAITLGDEAHHYLCHVMRRGDGDRILLFNGQDGEWEATLTALKKKNLIATCQNRTRPQQGVPDIALFFAPIKRDHLDYLVQKATELGVRALHPVITQHCNHTALKHDRLIAIAREAAEQSERLTLPTLHPALPLATLLEQQNTRPLFACLESGLAQPIATAFASQGQAAAILTGPEGGFSAEEMQLLRNRPNIIPISLGTRILRADTAALAALSCWQALCGDWPDRHEKDLP